MLVDVFYMEERYNRCKEERKKISIEKCYTYLKIASVANDIKKYFTRHFQGQFLYIYIYIQGLILIYR